MARTNLFFLVLLQFAYLLHQCEGRMDCAQLDFDDAYTDTGKVHCGPGFHECGSYGDGCCNNVKASPVQLTLVILGPATLLCSTILLVFVIKSVISVVLEEKHKMHSDISYAD